VSESRPGHRVEVLQKTNGKWTLDQECLRFDYTENIWNMCPSCEDFSAPYPEEFECEIDAKACADCWNLQLDV